MNSVQEEQHEYEKFMIKLAHKAQEVQKDFNVLSETNQSRVLSEVNNMLNARGLVGVLKHIISQR
ncbi:MAG: hypothetical protein IJ353_01485 [Lachnospiraceae bacterium]|nr:hypothetical protein [Lachnospiraceae bacterium]